MPRRDAAAPPTPFAAPMTLIRWFAARAAASVFFFFR